LTIDYSILVAIKAGFLVDITPKNTCLMITNSYHLDSIDGRAVLRRTPAWGADLSVALSCPQGISLGVCRGVASQVHADWGRWVLASDYVFASTTPA